MKGYPEVALVAAIALAIALMAWNFYINFSTRQVGSFEYIRIAEALLDRDKVHDAINYFEKAHISSPENDTVTIKLVDAYLQYGEELADKNN